MGSKAISHRPVALQPRIRDLDAVVRRQRAEIEGLRATLALIQTGSGASWWNEADISLKIAKLLRVLRLRYAKPNSPAWVLAQAVSRLADAWLASEKARVLSDEDRASQGPGTLDGLLGLGDPYITWKGRVEKEFDRIEGVAEVTHGPLISIVLPVYKVKPSMLKATFASLKAQSYDDWEVCVAFADLDREQGQGAANLKWLKQAARRDPRVRLKVLAENFGIAGNSNAALELARGDYIALLDHDDVLPPLALSRMAAAIKAQPEADFLYSDKENMSEGGERRHQPLFKPDWSPEMLYSVNYLTHLNLISADLMRAVGGWSLGVDGAQDWDLFLRATEKARCVVRVAGVGYSWRVHAASTASGMDAKPYAAAAQLRALERHAERIDLPGRFEPDADAGFRVRWTKVLPARLVIFGTGEPVALARLIKRLERERAAFTTVHVLVTPSDGWRLSRVWREQHGPLPDWCKLTPIFGDDPGEACLRLLANAPEAVTLILDGAVFELTPGALEQLSGWMQGDGPIAFASGLIMTGEDQVLEAGCVSDEAGVVHPLFRGERLRAWNALGGGVWHRNVETASPYLLALRTGELKRVLPATPRSAWRQTFHRVCQSLVDERQDGRGVVDPNARAILATVPPVQPQGLIGSAQRYLHPYLTIGSQGGIVFSKGPAREASAQLV